eukprot:4719787-Prymnesium_polylepis.1
MVDRRMRVETSVGHVTVNIRYGKRTVRCEHFRPAGPALCCVASTRVCPVRRTQTFTVNGTRSCVPHRQCAIGRRSAPPPSWRRPTTDDDTTYMDDESNAYLLERAENIAANRATLVALGIEPLRDEKPAARAPRAPRQTTPDEPKRESCAMPIRRQFCLTSRNWTDRITLNVVRSGRLKDAPRPKYADDPYKGVSFGHGNGGARKGGVALPRFSTATEAEAYDQAVKAGKSMKGPTFVIYMTESKVSGGFWCSMPHEFAAEHMPPADVQIVLEDEAGEAWA